MALATTGNALVGANGTRNKFLKELVKEDFCHYQVDGVQFGVLNTDEMARYGEMEVLNEQDYDAMREPVRFSPLDRHLGTPFRKEECATCGLRMEECQGHFGYVRLALPVYHVGFLKHIYNLMQCICKSCGRLLLDAGKRNKHLKQLRQPNIDDVRRKELHKAILIQCKKVKKCDYCQSQNTLLRKGRFSLLFKHQLGRKKGKSDKPDDISEQFESSFSLAKQNNEKLAPFIEKTHEDVTPLIAYNLLCQLTTQDRELLGMERPEHLLFSTIPVPPLCVRPTVSHGDRGLAEDDLTETIKDIVQTNKILRRDLEEGREAKNVLDTWNFVQEKAAIFINSEMPGLNLPKTGKKEIRSLCTRLKGKKGRFRGNLSAKRVDFSGRTVISPDPNVSVEEVVVPKWIARRMTFPERACRANIAQLQDCIRRGAEEHPGALIVRYRREGKEFMKDIGVLAPLRRNQLAEEIKYGDVVERHMQDGDIVLFNRQPSLHRLSMMAFRAKVMEGRTLRFNECVCGPFNADFDGDEMNIHLPQTLEARSEALSLMGVREGLVTPKSGEVAICATQDFLTAAFLLTQKSVFLTRDKFCQICCSMTDGVEQIDLPPPAILKPCELWTGKQVIGVMLRPNKQSKVLVNFEAPEKNYSKKGQSMCPADGWVIMRNSELLSGNLGKRILGGAKNGLYSRLIRDNSAEAAIACMNRLAKMSGRWLSNRGFTIGIDDVKPDDGVKSEKKKITMASYGAVDKKVQEFHAGTLELKPGCTAEQTLEHHINGMLSRVRNDVGDMCETNLGFMNKPRVMATCGSKGSNINLCQMMACLGQQIVGGSRIKDGFVNRSLPHFLPGTKEPKARGFVANSFYSGLDATEFFFHSMGGREGLVDTAVKTADSGYMQRRLMKALEDLSVKYDFTVRTSPGEVVQFAFGDDGLNPARMEGSASKPLDFKLVMEHVEHVMRPSKIVESENGAWRSLGSSGESQSSKRQRRSTDTTLEMLATPSLSLPQAPTRRAAVAVPRTQVESKCVAFQRRPLLPYELTELATSYANLFGNFIRQSNGRLNEERSQTEHELSEYIKNLAKEVATKRSQLGLVMGDTKESAELALKETGLKECLSLIDLGFCPTQMQLEAFVNRCAMKYVQAVLMPGEAVGAIAAQSIAEPATQMTLKTFHFAGVASMNVTLGVPRIKEIINATKSISTPIITCSLVDQTNELSARIVKGRIEKRVLGDICKYYKEVYDPRLGCFISVKIDAAYIKKLQLELSMKRIRQALLEPNAIKGFKLSQDDVKLHGDDKIRVFPPKNRSSDAKMMYFHLQSLLKALPNVVIHGHKSAQRVVINKDDNTLLVEGEGLANVMTTPGVNGKHTTSNHVIEVEKVLGIEAARTKIMDEIKDMIQKYGIDVDSRHIQMLGDCMTHRGKVLGINIYGISSMGASVLALASFERTTDQLFDAAAHQRIDPVKGVSERIILGGSVSLGTGLFKLLYDPGGRQATRHEPSLVTGGAVRESSTAGLSSVSTLVPTSAVGSCAVVGGHRSPLLSGWRKKQRTQ